MLFGISVLFGNSMDRIIITGSRFRIDWSVKLEIQKLFIFLPQNIENGKKDRKSKVCCQHFQAIVFPWVWKNEMRVSFSQSIC